MILTINYTYQGRKIVIFHTKYPKKIRVYLRSAHFFLSVPPLTWNPGSAPAYIYLFFTD